MLKQPLVLTVILVAGCGQGSESHGGPVRDRVSFVDTLRGRGVTVDIAGSVGQPFLHPQSGTTIRISGGTVQTAADLQSFDYASSAAASADAGQIQPDGSRKRFWSIGSRRRTSSGRTA